MSDVLEIVSRLEREGGSLRLDGDQIEYAIPKGNREAQALLAELREHRDRVGELLRQRNAEDLANRPAVRLDAAARFAQPHAKLFPFIGRKVRTPSGSGTLLQVFADRATVLLDSERDQVCVRFSPSEVIPVVPEQAHA